MNGTDVLGACNTRGAPLSLEEEVAESGDIVLLETGVSGRVWSPLHSLYAWLRHATSHAPYSRAPFVAKMDDDVAINAHELAAQLRLVRAAAPHPERAYYGRYYWTTWDEAAFIHSGSGYTHGSVARNARACLAARTCRGPFAFTTGSMMLLGAGIAADIGASELAAANIAASRALLSGPNASRRKTPAFEDVWLGFAAYALLPGARTPADSPPSLH